MALVINNTSKWVIVSYMNNVAELFGAPTVYYSSKESK